MKPEWLIIHRIINHRSFRDGKTQYLVKWRDLPYDQATWEDENSNVPGLKRASEYYWVCLDIYYLYIKTLPSEISSYIKMINIFLI